MKKSIIFAALISVLALSCKEPEPVKDDALEGETNGTLIGPGKAK